jgi:hypothetical protein
MSMQKNRALFASALCAFFILAGEAAYSDSYYLPGSDLEARQWMTFERSARAAYVVGFMNGFNHLFTGLDMAVATTRPFSGSALADEVYQALLNQPELRSGPIGTIVLHALSRYLKVTDKDGNTVNVDER